MLMKTIILSFVLLGITGYFYLQNPDSEIIIEQVSEDTLFITKGANENIKLGAVYRIFKFDSWSIAYVPIGTAKIIEINQTTSKLMITDLNKGYKVKKDDKLEFIKLGSIEQKPKDNTFEMVNAGRNFLKIILKIT